MKIMVNRRRYFLGSFFVLFFVLTTCIFSSHASDRGGFVSDQEMQAMIEDAQKMFQSKHKAMEQRASELFGINFAEDKKKFQAQLEELNFKMSLIEKIADSQERLERTRRLEEEYQNSGLFQYLQAYKYLENEIEKDHLFVGEFLSILEKVLAQVIDNDPIFRYAFQSRESEQNLGLILTKVVWQSNEYANVSAVTNPLNLHSIFADKTKIPMLIHLTPLAFPSLAYLRSVLIHELNHVYMYKDPIFSDVRKFSGAAIGSAEGEFSHYFKSLNPFNPSYQYHLIHEYYSFKTQLIFDEVVEANSFFKLDEANRKKIEHMLQWTYAQLNEKNRKFVVIYQMPPIGELIWQFYSSATSIAQRPVSE